MWNDTDIPLAHLITFRCYGTWLHGDGRGALDRFHNQYKSPYIPANYDWLRHNEKNLKHEPVRLNAWPAEHSPWVTRGSDYVLYGQGDELPDFD